MPTTVPHAPTTNAFATSSPAPVHPFPTSAFPLANNAKTTPLGMTVVHTASYAALAPGSAFALASALALAIASTGPDTRAPTRVRFSNTPAHVPTHTSAANTP